MIPLIATLRFQHRQKHKFNLWIPLFLIWVLLLPVLIIISPFFLLICLIGLINPAKAVTAFWEILSSIRGTNIEISEKKNKFFLNIH